MTIKKFEANATIKKVISMYCGMLGITLEDFIKLLSIEFIEFYNFHFRESCRIELEKFKRLNLPINLDKLRNNAGSEIELISRSFFINQFNGHFSDKSNHNFDPDIKHSLCHELGIEVKSALNNQSLCFSETTGERKTFCGNTLLIKTFCPNNLIDNCVETTINKIHVTDICFGFLCSSPGKYLKSSELQKSFIQIFRSEK